MFPEVGPKVAAAGAAPAGREERARDGICTAGHRPGRCVGTHRGDELLRDAGPRHGVRHQPGDPGVVRERAAALGVRGAVDRGRLRGGLRVPAHPSRCAGRSVGAQGSAASGVGGVRCGVRAVRAGTDRVGAHRRPGDQRCGRGRSAAQHAGTADRGGATGAAPPTGVGVGVDDRARHSSRQSRRWCGADRRFVAGAVLGGAAAGRGRGLLGRSGRAADREPGRCRRRRTAHRGRAGRVVRGDLRPGVGLVERAGPAVRDRWFGAARAVGRARAAHARSAAGPARAGAAGRAVQRRGSGAHLRRDAEVCWRGSSPPRCRPACAGGLPQWPRHWPSPPRSSDRWWWGAFVDALGSAMFVLAALVLLASVAVVSWLPRSSGDVERTNSSARPATSGMRRDSAHPDSARSSGQAPASGPESA